jgi:hypothetical protein
MQGALELVIAPTLLAPIEMTAQQTAARNTSTTEGGKSLNSEDVESYKHYSMALKVKEPAVLAWTIVRETRAFQMCLEPARDQESIYRPMIDDYAFENKKTLVLQRRFRLSAYTLVGRGAWATTQSIARDPTRSVQETTFAVLSAVGFNRDRTRALLCLWANNSGTCYFMASKEGTWQIDRSWRGGGCGWAY